jgi:putative heme transporter
MKVDPRRAAENESRGGGGPQERVAGDEDEPPVAAEDSFSPAAPEVAPTASTGVQATNDPVPRWLRSSAAIAWRLLALAAAIALSAYALAYVRVVVLPVIVALLVSTVLRPPTRWLMHHRLPDGVAAATVLLTAIALLAVALMMAGAAIGRQFSDLADSVQAGIHEAGDALSQPPSTSARLTSNSASTVRSTNSATQAAR